MVHCQVKFVTYCLQLHTFNKMIIKNISFETASFIFEFVMNGKSLSVKVQKQLVYPSVISGYLLYFGYVRKDTEQIISSIKKLYKKERMICIIFSSTRTKGLFIMLRLNNHNAS